MRVLVIEDEPEMAAVIQEALEHEGHHVTLAATGTDGLALASDFAFEIIILDCMLPGLEGTEVALKLRKRGSVTPILMLTARDAVADVVSGLDSGVDDYITKPFAFAELFARIRALRRRPATTPRFVLKFADLELDPQTQEVLREGVPIQLTRTEFRILEILMRDPDKAHHREAMINAVWGYDYTVESNTLDAFIKQLRTKIDSGQQEKLIQTVRGFGYRLAKEFPRS
jgi:DNA-binding response OmpR family regulator